LSYINPNQPFFTYVFIVWLISFGPTINAYEASEENVLVLLDQINTSNKSDENKIKLIMDNAHGDELVFAQLKLVSVYRNSDQHQLAKSLLEDLLKRLDSFNNSLQIEILISAAQMERYQNNYAKASDIMLSQALGLATPESIEKANVYRLIGIFYRQQMKLKEAKEFYNKALALYKLNNDLGGVAKIHGSLGVLYKEEGDLSLAAEFQKKSMVYFEKTNDISELADSTFSLGELYYSSKEYDKSLNFYLRALTYDKQLNHQQHIGYDYHRIGTIYFTTKDYQKAKTYTTKAIEIFREGAAFQVLSRAYIQLAEIHAVVGDEASRIISLEQSKEAALLAPTEHQLSSVWHSLGRYYFDHSNFSLAREYVEKSLPITTKLGLLERQLNDNLLLSDIHKALLEDATAHNYLSTAYELKNQLSSEQRIKETERHKRDINLLEEKVKVTKLEEQSVRAHEEAIIQKSANQRIIMIFLSILIAVLVFAYSLYQRRKIAILKAKLYEEALMQKNQLLADVSHELRTPLTALKLQVDALRYQLVDNVELSYQKLSTKITDLSLLISDIYDLAISDVDGLSFEATKVDLIPVFTEWGKEFTNDIESQGLQWSYSFDADEAIVLADLVRIKQVILNIISNSIKYTDIPGQVTMTVKTKLDKVVIIIQDSTPSVAEEDLENIFERLFRGEKSRNRRTGGAGLGLSICQNIINAHNGHICAENSRLGGVSILIELPITSN